MINHYTVDLENPKSWDEYFYLLCQRVASNSKCLSRKISAVIVLDKTVISTGYNGPPRGVRRCDERWLVDSNMRKYVIDKMDSLDALDNGRYEEFIHFDKYIKDNEYIWQGCPSYPSNKFNALKNHYFFKEHLKGKCPRYIPEMGFKSGQGLQWCVAGHAERNSIVNSAREGLHELKGTQLYMTCGVPCTPCLVEIINSGINEMVVTKLKDGFYDTSAEYLLNDSKIKIRTYDFIKE